jgi:hypothetical protein
MSTEPASVIETGTPGAQNTISLPLGGNVLEWSPFALTDFTLNMFGGPGSVVTIGDSELSQGSALNLSTGENLINFGDMVVDNSQLTVGGALAGSGTVTGVQGGTIAADNAATTEVIDLRSSNLDIGTTSNFLAPVIIEDGSAINLNGNLTVAHGQNFSVYSTGPSDAVGGAVINSGQVTAMGNMMLDANLKNTGDNGNAGINITDNGHLTITGDVTGGGIGITSRHVGVFCLAAVS